MVGLPGGAGGLDGGLGLPGQGVGLGAGQGTGGIPGAGVSTGGGPGGFGQGTDDFLNEFLNLQ